MNCYNQCIKTIFPKLDLPIGSFVGKNAPKLKLDGVTVAEAIKYISDHKFPINICYDSVDTNN